jgi:hypothetical protein
MRFIPSSRTFFHLVVSEVREVGKHQLILGLLPQPQEFHLSILDEVGILAHVEYGFHYLDEFGTNEGHDE